ncbi:MAG TPA: ribonuclease D [Pseudomonadales bacterium]|nr:ribonuclease D [Pseudomonadales bacterium]
MTEAAEFTYIDTDEGLAEVIRRLREVDVVAVDTEFARSHTYYPEVGLVQIYDGRECYLVDPLEIDDLTVLGDLLSDTSVIKVLHACSEDLEVFQYAVGKTPVPAFDTQIASAALGLSFAVSYQSLVEHYLGLNIPKEETRSDWLQRPLSQSQLEYAALDVIHLLEVYHKQIEALDETGKTHWVAEECSSLGSEISITLDPDACYLKVKSAVRMTQEELNRLQVLCAWRERLARQQNVPRNRVVEEKALVAVTRADIRQKGDLREMAGLTPRQVRKYGDDMLFLLEEARLVPAREFPPLVVDNAINVSNESVKMLKKVVEARAESLNVAPELLAKRRHLEQLVRSKAQGDMTLPDPLTGWREEVIGQHLIDALADR